MDKAAYLWELHQKLIPLFSFNLFIVGFQSAQLILHHLAVEVLPSRHLVPPTFLTRKSNVSTKGEQFGAWLKAQQLRPFLILQAEYQKKPDSRLETVITIMSRPVRIVKGHEVAQSVDESLFHEAQERELYAAAKAAASEIDQNMSISAFLEVC